VRHALRALDEDMPIIEMQSMDSLLSRSLLEERYRTLVVGLFSALATLIAVVGVAGVAARAISQRMRELGIRAALGATSLQIVQLVCRQGIVPVLAGILSALPVRLPLGAYCASTSSQWARRIRRRSQWPRSCFSPSVSSRCWHRRAGPRAPTSPL
jgi:hypothetical protein